MISLWGKNYLLHLIKMKQKCEFKNKEFFIEKNLRSIKTI